MFFPLRCHSLLRLRLPGNQFPAAAAGFDFGRKVASKKLGDGNCCITCMRCYDFRGSLRLLYQSLLEKLWSREEQTCCLGATQDLNKWSSSHTMIACPSVLQDLSWCRHGSPSLSLSISLPHGIFQDGDTSSDIGV